MGRPAMVAGRRRVRASMGCWISFIFLDRCRLIVFFVFAQRCTRTERN